LTFKQALELGGNVRKGEHGTKVLFVKQLQVRNQGDDETAMRLVPMLREYTVFNVEQGENLPDSIITGKPMANRDKKRAKKGVKIEPLPNWTLHDLRRTAKTLMARDGCPLDCHKQFAQGLAVRHFGRSVLITLRS